MRRWVPKFGTRPRASGSGTGPVVQHLPLFQQRLLPVPCLRLTSGKPTVSEQRRQLCPKRGKICLILLRDGDRDARGSTNSARGCDAGQTLPICSLRSARNRAQSKDAAFEMGVTNTRVSSTGWESQGRDVRLENSLGFFVHASPNAGGKRGLRHVRPLTQQLGHPQRLSLHPFIWQRSCKSITFFPREHHCHVSPLPAFELEKQETHEVHKRDGYPSSCSGLAGLTFHASNGRGHRCGHTRKINLLL